LGNNIVTEDVCVSKFIHTYNPTSNDLPNELLVIKLSPANTNLSLLAFRISNTLDEWSQGSVMNAAVAAGVVSGSCAKTGLAKIAKIANSFFIVYPFSIKKGG
jgi:hypothetical protein